MARTILDAQLYEIKTTVIQLGALVATALDQALQALPSGDQVLCNQVIESDNAIDSLCLQVERLTFRTMTLQQPIFGRDTRFLSSIPAIVADLERIGDNAAGIAKLRLLMTRLQTTSNNPSNIDPSIANGGQNPLLNHIITEDSIVSKLLNLGQEACRVLWETLYAFEQSDARTAHKVWREDDLVDMCYHLARRDLMTTFTSIHAIPALRKDSLIVQRMTYWLWIAHKLERIGDHCTNICERIVFILEGFPTIHPTRTA